MTKNKDEKKNEYIIYYCNKHFTTIGSDKKNKEGKKFKVSKCYARVFYFKGRIFV